MKPLSEMSESEWERFKSTPTVQQMARAVQFGNTSMLAVASDRTAKAARIVAGERDRKKPLQSTRPKPDEKPTHRKGTYEDAKQEPRTDKPGNGDTANIPGLALLAVAAVILYGWLS